MWINDAILQIVKHVVMANFVTYVFLVAIFDSTFADQNVKKWWMCTYINHFLKHEGMSFQKSNKKKIKKKIDNASLETYGIFIMNLEFAVLECPKVI